MTTIIRVRSLRGGVQTRNLHRTRVHSDGRVSFEVLDSPTSQRIALRGCLLKCGTCIFLALMLFFVSQYILYDVVNYTVLGIALILGVCLTIGGLIAMCEEIKLTKNFFKQNRAERLASVSTQHSHQKEYESTPDTLEEIFTSDYSRQASENMCEPSSSGTSLEKNVTTTPLPDPSQRKESLSRQVSENMCEPSSSGTSPEKNVNTTPPPDPSQRKESLSSDFSQEN